MATVGELSGVARIGEAAGELWQYLDASGHVSLTTLTKEIELPRDVLMQAVGWLAREDKISIDEDRRTKKIGLKQP